MITGKERLFSQKPQFMSKGKKTKLYTLFPLLLFFYTGFILLVFTPWKYRLLFSKPTPVYIVSTRETDLSSW